jgi:hypothetical protein
MDEQAKFTLHHLARFELSSIVVIPVLTGKTFSGKGQPLRLEADSFRTASEIIAVSNFIRLGRAQFKLMQQVSV